MAVAYRSVALPPVTTPDVNLQWGFFDSRVSVGDFGYSTMTGYSETSTGRAVRVSLRLSPPPASSHVQIYAEGDVHGRPRVLYADGDLLLIHMTVAVEGKLPGNYPDNFFVYKADPDWPWLRRLPLLEDCIDDGWPWYPKLPRLLHWVGRGTDTVIVRGSSEDYHVANLKIHYTGSGENLEEVPNLLLYSSTSKQWEAKQLKMPPDPNGVYRKCRWRTGTVLSFRGFACWVDYHRGIIFYDLQNSVLDFIYFPGIDLWEHEHGLPAKHRTVSISSGDLKFIDIDNGRYQSTAKPGCTITTWILRIPGLTWVSDNTLELEDLWAARKYEESRLPQCIPKFPIIDWQESNIVHFILESDKTWIITVDMRKKNLVTYRLYKNEVQERDGTRDVSNFFFNRPFICSKLCSYLAIPTACRNMPRTCMLSRCMSIQQSIFSLGSSHKPVADLPSHSHVYIRMEARGQTQTDRQNGCDTSVDRLVSC